jgi:leishmanolysin-like peptidase
MRSFCLIFILCDCVLGLNNTRMAAWVHHNQDRSAAQQQLLVRSLEDSIATWQNVLLMKKSTELLHVPRTCAKSLVYHSCPVMCNEALPREKCGEYFVPDRHVGGIQTCQSGTVVDARHEYIGCTHHAEGTGLEKIDFVIYTQTIQTDACTIPGVRAGALAWASPCHMDPITDRPVSGFINICPSVLDSILNSEMKYEDLRTTVVHEIAHALGFTAILMAYWRDSNGNPRSPRVCNGKIPSDDMLELSHGSKKVRIPKPNDTVLHFQSKRDFKDAVLITPEIQRITREFYGCPTAKGAPLENQSPYPIWGSHWEERILGTALMSGTLNSVMGGEPLSPFTLALFQDSGWYNVNYASKYVKYPTWGYKQGCAFLEKPCIVNGKATSAPFCDTQSRLGCTSDHRSIAKCNIKKYDTTIPPQFRYFDDKQLGGMMEMCDYCPFYGMDQHKVCDDGSACFERDDDSSTVSCYQYECDKEQRIRIMVNGTTLICGTEHTDIKCPKYEILCGF